MGLLGPNRLRDLIINIRSSKTAAGERAVINKESAAIRTGFKEGPAEYRAIHLAKLLYIFLLGYPAHFGQIECLKLGISPLFKDKRLGYLGTQLLLDENHEILTLVTNCLKNDMNSKNVHVMSIALSTFANIAGKEMSRDLNAEIEKHMSDPKLQKLACICAIRMIRKVPDLVEQLLPRIPQIYKQACSSSSHPPVISLLELMTEMASQSEVAKEKLGELMPSFTATLAKVVRETESTEFQISGVPDPFLQVKFLKLFKVLGTGSALISEQMNDILTSICINTDPAKNCGNAILYEAVRTIFAIQSDQPLRVLAINILGKFLTNKDTNIRYVALDSLLRVIHQDNSAVQRHRSTILDCLKENDISIKKRALELCFALIDTSNVRVMIKELLVYLETICDESVNTNNTENFLVTATKICELSERFAPNRQWLFDSYLAVLKLCTPENLRTRSLHAIPGCLSVSVSNSALHPILTSDLINEELNEAKSDRLQEIIGRTIKLLNSTPALHQAALSAFYGTMKAEAEFVGRSESLVCCGLWMLGEHGNLLLKEGAVTNTDILQLFKCIQNSPFFTPILQQYFLTCILKWTVRSPVDKNQILDIIGSFSNSVNHDIQQRSFEFQQILNANLVEVLEQMPTSDELNENGRNIPTADEGDSASAGNLQQTEILNRKTQTTNDILSLIQGTNVKSAPAKPAIAQADLLSALFADNSTSSNKEPASPQNLFSPTAAIKAQSSEIYNKNGLVIRLSPAYVDKGNGVLAITAEFRSTNGNISALNFQVAVPKTAKLQMFPPSSQYVSLSSPASQVFHVTSASPPSGLRLRFKLAFKNQQEQSIEDLVTFEGFPFEI